MMEGKPLKPWMYRALEKARSGDMKGFFQDVYEYVDQVTHQLMDLYLSMPRLDWPLLHAAIRVSAMTMEGIMNEDEKELVQMLCDHIEVYTIDEDELKRQSGQQQDGG